MPPTESSAIRPNRVASTHGESSYVLIALPNATRAASFRQVAMETGHPVVVVRDGEEAQAQIASRGVPTLLITDLSLPKLDGFTLVRGLRQQPRGETTDVIVISAFQPLRAAAKEISQSLNFARILPADVDQSALRTTIQTLVGTVNDTPRRRPGPPPPAPAQGGLTQAAIMAMVARQVVEAAIQHGVETCAGLVTLGADEPLLSVYSSNPRLLGDNESSLLRDVATEGEPLIIADTESHPLFSNERANPRGVRGFAAMPVTLSGGKSAGALCLLDSRPLRLSADDLDAFAATAATIAKEIERHVPRGDVDSTSTAASEIQALERLAITDELTGLINRRGGEATIGNEIARAKRHRTPLTCVLIDIDRFKMVNDTFGHQVGDSVLRELSALFKRTLRTYDTVVRWGGEEFLLVLPGVSLEDAQRLADRIRRAVEAIEFPGAGRITLSAGAAGLGLDYSFEEMLATADRRLYQAKSSGRNTVI
jgi:diguanylate cyclase (GGDEF)-like protein